MVLHAEHALLRAGHALHGLIQQIEVCDCKRRMREAFSVDGIAVILCSHFDLAR